MQCVSIIASKGLPLTDEEELVQAARTDRAAFGQLYDRHFDAVFGYILRRVGDVAVAEDIAGSVWERALIAIERFEVRGIPFAAWLYRIAGNQIANHTRRRRLLGFVPFTAAHESSDDPSALSDERKAVRDAMKKLSDADQEVLALFYYAGLQPHQMAEVLGCSTAAVHKRLHRAKSRLKDQLEGDSRVPASA